jgi:hypothetical protein
MDDTRFDVRRDCEFVTREARAVRIDHDALTVWARGADPSAIRPVVRPAELAMTGSPEELTRWVLLLDSLNFCFWSQPGENWEVEYAGRRWGRYYAMVAGLHRAVNRDRSWLEPRRWAAASLEDVAGIFAGQGCIPMPARRVEVLAETGQTALERFRGEPIRLVEQAGFDAARIACLLADSFRSFRDVHSYHGRNVAILKRAQIFAADLAAAWKASGGAAIVNLEALTAFADYRVPQILRHLGILVLDANLATRIDCGEPVRASSTEEIEIRACTVWATELMARALQSQRGVEIPAWILDEYLWQRSHDPEVTVQHHRTLTCYY